MTGNAPSYNHPACEGDHHDPHCRLTVYKAVSVRAFTCGQTGAYAVSLDTGSNRVTFESRPVSPMPLSTPAEVYEEIAAVALGVASVYGDQAELPF
jgi:hypothetical protein